MSENSKTVNEHESPQVERRGELDVCPICGSGVHPQAYYCPKCSNYYCFVCRARVSQADVSVQCTNRDCDFFGKLVCSQCDPANTVQEQPYVYQEPTDGYWPAWLLASLAISAFVIWETGWLAGSLAFLGVYGGIGYLMQSLGCNIFGKKRNVEISRTSSNYACVRCSHPAKPLSFSRKS